MSEKQMRKKYPGSNVSPFSDECSKRIVQQVGGALGYGK